MTTLADGQMELRAGTSAALVIGNGTAYRWTNESWIQWWSAPTVRTFDMERGGVDGLLAGRDLLGSQATPMLVQIIGDSAEDLGDKIDAWKAACAVSSDLLVTVRANVLGRTRRRYGRFRIPGEIIPRGKVTIGGHVANAACQFEALDPITYGDTATSAQCTREIPGAGFEVPFTPPFSLPAATTGGLSIVNSGNRAGAWQARLDGPLQYPEITHTTSGKRLFLSLDANGGVDLTAGQYVILDSKTRAVLLNGTSDRRSQLTIDSEWWDHDPGQNDYLLRADDGTGTLTVTAYDAWHS